MLIIFKKIKVLKSKNFAEIYAKESNKPEF